MIVLDTHAWLWWLHDPRKLGRRGKRLIERSVAHDEARVSVISLWEVALKNQLGKLMLPLELDHWRERALAYPGIEITTISPDDAVESTRLPGTFHRDPADRFIVTLARRLGATLVTRDKRIQAYGHVQTVW